ncbi:MAG: pilus assembly protein PilM [Burkholderiaceae bacterium]|jgi:type IV pilus assembly protein PilM|nr:pilus assembly protein PilM [Burkholderiaceae bacterium]
MMGLDISASSIKLVELAQDRAGSFTLEHCGIELLARGWVGDGNIEKFDEVVGALRRVIGKSASKTRDVAMALPASVVISKKIILPSGLSEREMEVQVESEANQYIPFSLDEVSLDFCVMGPGVSSPGEVEVMISASRKEKVADRQALAEAAGLHPVVLDVESYASRLAAERVIRLLPGGGVGLVIALFEIGAVACGMQVLHGDDLIYEREQIFGGAQLTQMLAQQYGFTLEEAESKKRSGELPGDYGLTVLKPFVESLAQEVERALGFFFTSTLHHRVDYILLAGGTASVAGLAKAITRHTSVACQVVNPFNGMRVGRRVREKTMLREAPSYLTACGLAMRRFLR